MIVEQRPAQAAVEQILRDCWVPYMRGDEKPDGYPSHACGGIQNYTSLDWDSTTAYEGLNLTLAEKCDAVIHSLPPAEQCAIHHVYLRAVYRFNREPLEQVLERAMLGLEIGLRARDVWLG